MSTELVATCPADELARVVGGYVREYFMYHQPPAAAVEPLRRRWTWRVDAAPPFVHLDAR
jgi:hypothetical protein